MGYGGTILIPWSPHGEPNIIRVIKSRRMRMARYVEPKGGIRNAHRVLVGKPEGKISLRGSDRRKILECVLREIEWVSVNWIHLAQVRGQWWDIVKR
jgi:hypothetical protein